MRNIEPPILLLLREISTIKNPSQKHKTIKNDYASKHNAAGHLRQEISKKLVKYQNLPKTRQTHKRPGFWRQVHWPG